MIVSRIGEHLLDDIPKNIEFSLMKCDWYPTAIAIGARNKKTDQRIGIVFKDLHLADRFCLLKGFGLLIKWFEENKRS